MSGRRTSEPEGSRHRAPFAPRAVIADEPVQLMAELERTLIAEGLTWRESGGADGMIAHLRTEAVRYTREALGFSYSEAERSIDATLAADRRPPVSVLQELVLSFRFLSADAARTSTAGEAEKRP